MSYSHPATRQDEWVQSIRRGRGLYLEIGAYDGYTHSNTLALEKMGWEGALVECNPDILPALIKNRGEAQVIPACVVDEKRPVRFYKGGEYSGLVDRLPVDWLRGHVERGNPTIDMENQLTMDELYKLWVPRFGPTITYLSLDTEGGELELLKTCSFLENIMLITVEFRYDRQLLDEFVELLNSTHKLHEVRGFDACFIRNFLWD